MTLRRRPITALGVVVAAGFAFAAPAELAATPAASAAGFSATETIYRDHLVGGANQVVDTRTVTVKAGGTTNLRERQQISVTWSGAHPTGGIVGDVNSEKASQEEYPVVLMECRGVDSTTVAASQRLSQETCWTQTPAERFDSSYTYQWPSYRLDRYASAADRGAIVAPSPYPAGCPITAQAPVEHWVPFVASSGQVYQGGLNGCGGMAPEAANFATSTVPGNTTYGVSDTHGNGAASFVAQSVESNASLGCSSSVKCALVVIPIMGMSCDPAAAGLPPADQPVPGPEADAAFALCSGTGHYQAGQLASSSQNQEDPAVAGRMWWAASNWRNRITIPLTFAVASSSCSVVNKSAPVDIYGSELMAQATEQWAPYFCLDPKLFNLTHVQTSEPEAKNLLASGGIEAAFAADPPLTPFGRPVVQAPVAVSGFAVSYLIDDASGHPYTKLRLSPRLLAKLLSESYPTGPGIAAGETGIAHNPYDMALDPEFQALNPGLPTSGPFDATGASMLLALSSNSDVTWALTSYLNADPLARAWLNGQPDPWGMVVNPAYKGLSLPTERWPLLDTFVYNSTSPCLQNPAPYLQLVAAPLSSMTNISLDMQFGIENSQLQCVNQNTPAVKLVALGREIPGQRFLLGVTSLADSTRYGMSAAALQTDIAGTTFASPTTASLRAAAAMLTPDTSKGAWLMPYSAMHSSPQGEAAYPGTMLLTADIPTSGLPKVDAARYGRFLSLASGAMQSAGLGNGQLPPGYLPLTAGNGLGGLAQFTSVAAGYVTAQSGTVPSLTNPVAVRTSSGPPTPTGTGPSTGGGLGARPGPSTGPHATTAPTPTAKATATGGSATVAGPIQPVGMTVGLRSGLAGLMLPLVLLLALVGAVAIPLTTYLGRRASE